MEAPVSTERWELRRGYLSRGRTERVNRSALWLASRRIPEIDRHRDLIHKDGTRNVQVVTVDYQVLVESDSPLLREPLAVPLFDLKVETAEETNDQSGFIMVQMYRIWSRFGWHIDQEPFADADDSLIVNTQGVSRIAIKNVYGETFVYDMGPGDAFYINNSGESHHRPEHTVYNASRKRRVAVVD